MEKPATDIYTFEDLRRRRYTYVDKTEILWPLVLGVGFSSEQRTITDTADEVMRSNLTDDCKHILDKSIVTLLIVLSLACQCLTAACHAATRTAFTGFAGEKAAKLLEGRVFSRFARGDAMDEAVNVFRTHCDDATAAGKRHAWWQGEYWGKTMLGHTGACKYTEREDEKIYVREQVKRLVEGFIEAYEYAGDETALKAAAIANATIEMCDVIYWMRLSHALYRATGHVSHLDRAECAFCNSFLAGLYDVGRWGAYSVRAHGTRHGTAAMQIGMKHHCCCVDNSPRGFYDMAEHAFVRRGEVVDVNYYLPCVAKLDEGIQVTVGGNYPVSETVTLDVQTTKPVMLALRVPKWCPELTVDGRVFAVKNGRVEIAPSDDWQNAFSIWF